MVELSAIRHGRPWVLAISVSWAIFAYAAVMLAGKLQAAGRADRVVQAPAHRTPPRFWPGLGVADRERAKYLLLGPPRGAGDLIRAGIK